MSSRKGSYSSKKKKTSGGSFAAGGVRAAAAKVARSATSTVAHALAVGGAAAHHPSYFPKDIEAARNKVPGGGRGRPAHVVAEPNGDPFQSVRLRSESVEAHMVQANLVLAAITELLRERGLDSATAPVNPTHYFGTLMVMIEQRGHSAETVGAILYLLSVLLPQLSKGVLKAKSEAVAEILIGVLDKHAADAHTAKHVLECCAMIVGSVVDVPSVWTASTTHRNTAKLLQVLLVYSLDHRPRIRRAGQEGVRDTLKAMYEHSIATQSSTGGRIGLHKPVNDTVVTFCIREISQCTPKDCQVVLFLCGLLQSCIQYLSVSAAGRIMEALLSMVGKGNSILVVQAMRTIDAFFIHASEIHLSPAASASVASSEAAAASRTKFLHMASQLLNVLLTLKPHQNDQLASAAYLHTLKNGLVHFTSALESGGSQVAVANDTLRACYDKVPELLALIGEGLLSPKPEVVKASTKAMTEILRKAVTQRMIAASMREAELRANMPAAGAALPPFYRVVDWMETMLGYRYKAEWNRILLLAGELFHSTCGSTTAQSLLLPLLRKLDVMHNESTTEVASENPERDYRPALDEALGAAIETLGPEQVLMILPLNLPTDFYAKKKASAAPLHEQLNASRSWLLPLFRAHVGGTASLAFFLDFFVPIGAELHGLEKVALQKSKLMESKVFAGLKVAVWDIFPQLCAALPKDLPQAYKAMVKTLVTSYLNVDEMGWTHAPICKALAAVIRKLKDIAQVEQAKAAAAAAAEKGDDADEDEDEEEAKATFDSDDDDEEEDADSDDEDAMAKAKAKRQAKKAAASKAAPKVAAAVETVVATPTASSARRPANFTLVEAREVITSTIAPVAKNILPVLFNLAAMPHEKKEAVYEAIAQYASIADAALLNDTFKTVLRKLLEHTMAAAAKKAARAEKKQQAADEAAAAAAADGSDDEETAMEDTTATGGSKAHSGAAHQELQRAHLLTDIVYALCAQSAAQLNSDNIAYLYKIVQNQLGSDADSEEDMDAALQKKLYKILAVLVALPGFFEAQWKDLVKDLQQTTPGMQAAALKPRLACVRTVLLHLPALMLKDKAALAVLPSFLGEVILASKESSARTRDAAFDILVDLGRKMLSVQAEKRAANAGASATDLFGGLQHAQADQPMLAEYVYMLAGGLAGSSAHMQSASVLCLARLLYEFKAVLGPSIVTALLATVLPFFECKSRELIKSLLAFVKVCMLTFPIATLEAQAPAIVAGLVQWCSEKKQRFKLKIKILIEILMKKLGVEFVRDLVPEEHTALVEHIRKTKEREKRQKAEAWQAKKGGKDDKDGEEDGVSHRPMQDYDSIMRDAEGDADMEDVSARGGQQGKKRGAGKDANAMWIRESDVDFMDPSVVSKVSSSNPSADVPRGQPVQYGHGVSQDQATGKMRIAGGAPAVPLKGAAAAAMLDIDELDLELKSKQREKRKRNSAADDEDDEEGGGQVAKKQQLPGSQFRSTKAGGDMMRRGQMAPHAFIALDPMAMNKRKKFTAARRLESIVNAAKSGSQSGSQIAKSHSRSRSNKGHKKHGHK